MTPHVAGTTTQEALLARAKVAEARLLLRYAASGLNETERLAIRAFMADVSATDAARAHGRITRGGIWMAQQSGLVKMRQALAQLGIESVEQIL
jgi:hypothetical protein